MTYPTFSLLKSNLCLKHNYIILNYQPNVVQLSGPTHILCYSKTSPKNSTEHLVLHSPVKALEETLRGSNTPSQQALAPG